MGFGVFRHGFTQSQCHSSFKQTVSTYSPWLANCQYTLEDQDILVYVVNACNPSQFELANQAMLLMVSSLNSIEWLFFKSRVWSKRFNLYIHLWTSQTSTISVGIFNQSHWGCFRALNNWVTKRWSFQFVTNRPTKNNNTTHKSYSLYRP